MRGKKTTFFDCIWEHMRGNVIEQVQKNVKLDLPKSPYCDTALLLHTDIFYSETDEGTVTTSGVCAFTHFEEIMCGCFKMYCRWKGTFSRSHAHVTVSFLFFTWAQWTMFWTEVPAGQCVVYTGVLVWKIETSSWRNIPKSIAIKEHNWTMLKCVIPCSGSSHQNHRGERRCSHTAHSRAFCCRIQWQKT